MDIEQDKILVKASNFWGQQLSTNIERQDLSKTESETAPSIAENYQQPKDFVERIFTKSTSFWSNLFFTNPQKDSQQCSRKQSEECGVLEERRCQEDQEDEFNLFHSNNQQLTSFLLDTNYNKSQVGHGNQNVGNHDYMDLNEESHPFGNPYFTPNIQVPIISEQQQEPLFYLDTFTKEGDRRQYNNVEVAQQYSQFPEPRISLQSNQSEKVVNNNYEIQNLTESKIRIRRTNSQNLVVRRKTFTPQEDQIIIKCLKLHGRDFSQIAQHLPGRTEQMIKNRYKSKIRKLLKNTQSMDTESDPKEKSSLSFQDEVQSEQNELLNLQTLLRNQFINNSGESPVTDQEKLQKIKQLQNEIEKIEDYLKNTKCEIIKEYLAIQQQKQTFNQYE